MSSEALFKLINELIAALAQWLWPLVVLFLALKFRPEIRAILGRLRKGKILGQELELESSLEAFRETVQKADQEVSQASSEGMVVQGEVAERTTKGNGSKELDKIADSGIEKYRESQEQQISKIIDYSATNPLAALILLSQTLEKEIKVLAVASGILKADRKHASIQLLDMMAARDILPQHAADSLRQFWDVRNKVIHGGQEVSDKDILRVIDTGLQLLRTIQRVPSEVITVYHPGMPVYSDEACTTERDEVKGIVLHYKSPGTEMNKIWPVAKDAKFVRGKHVTKEWDCNRKWAETWYRDPETGQRRLAWTDVCEFVGKQIEGV